MTTKNNQVTNDVFESKIQFIRQNDEFTVSRKIRELSSLGVTRSEIAKILNIRYQHVRNVLITPVKRSS